MKMPVTDADLQLIFKYLDGELSDGEEQQLLQRMQENPQLQQAFDQQVLMSEYLLKSIEMQTGETAFESADSYVNRINSITDNKGEPKIVRLPAKNNRWQPIAAAAAVVAIIFAAVVYFSGKRNTGTSPVVKTPDRVIPATKDSTSLLPDTSRQLANLVLPQQLYEQYATPLADDDLQITAAARPYQNQYKQGRYTELTVADESIVTTKGERLTGEEQAIINYFNFYKALSYIKINQPVKAKKLLQNVLAKSGGNMALNNHTKWYLLLLSLKADNKPEALQIAALMAADGSNRYQTPATEIQQKLGAR